MTNRILIIALVVAEALSLLQLKSSLTSYAKYWQKQKQLSGQLTYVALGDSTAQGIGASQPNNGYVGLVAARLAQQTGKTVRIVNLSVSGAKLADVLNTQIPQLKNYQPDYVTIEAGANDIVAFDAASFEKEFGQLVGALPAGTVVANMPNFGGRIKKTQEVATANKIITIQTKQANLPMADLYHYTKTRESLRNYAADFFHPSNRGYKNWADAFWAVLKDV